MYFIQFIIAITISILEIKSQECQNVMVINNLLRDTFKNQPLYLVLLPDTQQNRATDNECITLFPLPDNPDTYFAYVSTVYCNGSYSVVSAIASQVKPGVQVISTANSRVVEYVIDRDGDFFIEYRCNQFGEPFEPFILGTSRKNVPLNASSIARVQQVTSQQGLPSVSYYPLPLRLPSRCVTRHPCTKTCKKKN